MAGIFMALEEYLINMENNKSYWQDRIEEFEKELSYFYSQSFFIFRNFK